ncbi:hypothetical protein AVEN_226791-1, partial [Araneus ventricosus]
ELLDEEAIIRCKEWVRKKVKLEKKVTGKKEKEIIKVIKENKQWNSKELVACFQEDMKAFKKHVFNIQQQYKAYRTCIDNLDENEAVVQIDFRENCNCKLSEEDQSHHFGDSRNQVSYM